MKNLRPEKSVVAGLNKLFIAIPSIIIFFFILNFSGTKLYAQTNIDSLKQLLNSRSEKEKANLLNQISNAYFSISPDSSIFYGRESLKYAKINNIEKEIIRAYENLAGGYAWMPNYDSSMLYANKALSKIGIELQLSDDYYRSLAGRLYYNKGFIFQKWGNRDSSVSNYEKVCKIFEHDSLMLAHTYNSLGLVEFRYGANYERAVNYYLAALTIAEKMRFFDIQSYVIHNLAMVYYEWDQPEKSLEYYLKSYELIKKSGNKNDLGEILNSIGLITVALGDTISGIDYYLQALNMEEENNDKKGVGYIKNDLGYLMISLKRYEEAKRYLEVAEQIAVELNIIELIVNVNKNLGIFYQKTGDISKALFHLNRSQEIAIKSDISINYMNNYKMYYLLYLDQGNYKKALEYYLKYSGLKDSLFSEEKHEQIAELQTKYETESQIERNELLEKENEVTSLQLKKSRVFLNSVVIISVLGILLFTIVFILFRRRQKNKQLMLEKESELRLMELEKKIYSTEIEVQEKERRRFAKDLHDGLGPLLSSLKLYFNKLIEPGTSQKDELVSTTKEILNEAIVSTRSVAHNIMPIAVAELDLVDSINKFIFRLTSTSGIHFSVDCEKELIQFSQPEKLVLYRVITELITNTIKHAAAQNVTIFVKKENSQTQILYTDDGKGFNSAEIKTGLGIKNINDRINSIGGEVKIYSQLGEGMKASIYINH